MRGRYRIIAAVVLAVLAGASLWAALGRPATGCTPKPDDPEQYLARICEYIRANHIDVSPGDPDGYTIKAIDERVEDGRPVVWVFLNCCYMGDIAVIDKQTGAVIRFQIGPQ